MSVLRAIIIVGQVGSIWANRKNNRRVFKTMSVVGYTLLMERLNRKKSDNVEVRNINGQIIIIPKQKKEWFDYTAYNFKFPDLKKIAR